MNKLENFKETIKNKGLKITWIAEQIGRKQPELSMWLNGNRPMPEAIEKSLDLLLK